jgi:hypothetical protein
MTNRTNTYFHVFYLVVCAPMDTYCASYCLILTIQLGHLIGRYCYLPGYTYSTFDRQLSHAPLTSSLYLI